MTLRLILRVNEYARAEGDPSEFSWRTFDVSLPEVEAELRKAGNWRGVCVVGAELLDHRDGRDNEGKVAS